MKAAYVARTTPPAAIDAGDEWYDDGHRKTIDVLVTGETARDTGLVDQHGVTIYRVPSQRKAGFCR